MKKIWMAVICGVCLMVAAAFAATGEKIEAEGGAEGFVEQRPEYEPQPSYGDSLVEVMVDGMPQDIYSARGRRYVEALRGEEYQLRVRNPFPVRVAVSLSVDGLNTIDARRTTRWDASKWVIEPYGTITVSGWQMSRERARRFYFTNERDAYASKLGRPSDLGVISAVFFRERRAVAPLTRPYPSGGDPRNRGEKESDSSRAESRDDAGSTAGAQARRSTAIPAPAPDDEYAATGIGRSVQHDVRWVNLDLDPRPAAEATIRYEYRDALVRLGVLPRPYPAPDALRRRERARGFEDHPFSPEP